MTKEKTVAAVQILPRILTKEPGSEYNENCRLSEVEGSSESISSRGWGQTRGLMMVYSKSGMGPQQEIRFPHLTMTLLNCTAPQDYTAAGAAKLLQSCPTLCDPIDGSPPGSPVPGIL